MIELREIDKGNFEAVMKLAVREDQQGFVASNVFSMAQARVYPSCQPLAVYSGGTPVGFVMFGADDEDDGHWWLIRLMVDAAHQGKGYGRQALRAVAARVRAVPGVREMYLSVEPENTDAIALYRSEGFEFDGRVLEGEQVMKLAW